MVEAYAAEVITNDGRTVPANVVGYDHETGFGLLRTIEPLKIKPIPFGKIADVKEKDVVVVASGGGASMVVAGATWSASASSPATGNICSTRRSSPRRRIRPGAAPH